MNNNENAFWSEMNIYFPDIVKAITSLSKKSYISITNLNTGITWWSERAVDYFGLEDNYTIRGKEKPNKSIHPDDIEIFRRGFRERVEGRNLDKPWEYRIGDGNQYNLFSAMARMLYDNEGKPFIVVIRYDNHGISDEVDSVTGLYTDSMLNHRITELISSHQNNSALLKIALDQFSHINVMYGVTFSDVILNRVAQILLHM